MEYYIIVQDMGYYNDIVHAITTDEDDARRLYNELNLPGKSLIRYVVNLNGKVVSEKQVIP
jgi:hypothetical protein